MVNKTVAIFITILLFGGGGVIFTPDATPSNAQADLTSTPTPTETLAELSSPTPAETSTPAETPTPTPEASATPEMSVTDTPTHTPEASATLALLLTDTPTHTPDTPSTLTPLPDGVLPFPTAAPEGQTSPETGTPEPTETPSGESGLRSGQAVLSATTSTCFGATRVEQAIATITDLVDYIHEANANPTSHYILQLTAGADYTSTFQTTFTTDTLGASAYPYITGCVTIEGNGAIIERSPALGIPLFRIFTVNGGFLRLENVTIQGGRASWLGGGGVLNHQGTLQVYRSTIINNRVEIQTRHQTLGGGIYSFWGDLSVTESRIINNRALTNISDGGGIGVIRNRNSDISIRGNEISGNHAQRRGNGVYITDPGAGAVQMSDNCFVGNHYPSSVLNTSIYVPSDTRLERSWWGIFGGPIVSQDTALPAAANQDSLYNSLNYAPFLTAAPASCTQTPPCPPSAQLRGDVCQVPTATPTPIPTLNPDDIEGLLYSFLPYPDQDELSVAIAAIRSVGIENFTDSTQIPLPTTLYRNCDQYNRINCVKYSYLIFFALFLEATGYPPTVWHLLSVNYYGELVNWKQLEAPVQALYRNFADSEIGGCRFANNAYQCGYDNVIGWLSGMQHWFLDSKTATVTEDYILTKPLIITGVSMDNLLIMYNQNPIIAGDIVFYVDTSGIFNYDKHVFDSISLNHVFWRSGVSIDHPSYWGNRVLTTGTADHALGAEEYLPIIVHVLADGNYDLGEPGASNPPPAGAVIRCTYLAVITTSEGRFTTKAC